MTPNLQPHPLTIEYKDSAIKSNSESLVSFASPIITIYMNAKSSKIDQRRHFLENSTKYFISLFFKSALVD